ncbi:GNAT family N-acetyltransferase [Nitriliruptor alkaliphilus]|uniref:GNAT family N-acetyltransferase n=1 Tax=Nitriliruptor alkaliphilus TaxID=427918 RepID=UPI001B805678|nr:GNAT family N-acetyltransferase [Nitriliruptor alkaliphilus]
MSADAGPVSSVHTRTWQIAYRGLLPDQVLDHLDTGQRADGWREILATRDGPSVLLAVSDTAGAPERVVGFVAVGASRDEDAGDRRGEVHAIYVDPDHWAAGIGTDLLAAGTEQLRQRGWTTATLWVLSANTRTRAFYERHGWRTDGHTRVELVGGAEAPHTRYAIAL